MLKKALATTRDGGLRALTSQKEDAIAAAVARGVPVGTAAKLAGIGERTFRSWLRIAAEDRSTWEDGTPVTPAAKAQMLQFATRIEQALAECEAKCAQAITDSVGVVGKSGVPEWRPALEWLKHSPTTRERWHEYRQVEVNHTVELPPIYEQVKSWSDEELERAAYGEDPQLEEHSRP